MYHYSKLYLFKKVFSLMLCLAIFANAAHAQTMSKKRGMAYGYHSEADLTVLSNSVSWWYKLECSTRKYGGKHLPKLWYGLCAYDLERVF